MSLIQKYLSIVLIISIFFGCSMPKIFQVVVNQGNLVDKEMSPGSYTVTLYTENLSSGLYFYTLATDNKTVTKKMLLLK